MFAMCGKQWAHDGLDSLGCTFYFILQKTYI